MDLGPELISALRSSEGRQAVADIVRPVFVETLRAELERRDADRLMSSSQLAAFLGISTKALGMRLQRGSQLGAISFELDGRRVWRRTEVDALLATTPRLRAVGGQ